MKTEFLESLDRVKFEIDFVCLGSSPGHWRQSSYRSGIFDAFQRTYPHVSGDAMREYVAEQFRGDEKEDIKLVILSEVATAWREWFYAWDHHEVSAAGGTDRG